MTDHAPLVGFAFGYRNRRPSNAEELKSDPWMRLQKRFMTKFADEQGRSLGTVRIGFLVGRRKAFLETPHFQTAVKLARAQDADLIVGDLKEMLSRTPVALISRCIEVLDSLDVEFWDAMSGLGWSSINPASRKWLEEYAQTVSRGKSHSIRCGLMLADRKRPTSSKNAALAARTNVAMADQRANELRAFVDQERIGLPAGTSLSASVLARRLNEEGELAPRGGRWSHNGAKNLLGRLELLANAEPVID